MSNKVKMLTLTSGWNDGTEIGTTNGYRVEKIVNSIEFTPLSILNRKTVDILCDSKDWQVTITAAKE